MHRQVCLKLRYCILDQCSNGVRGFGAGIAIAYIDLMTAFDIYMGPSLWPAVM